MRLNSYFIIIFLNVPDKHIAPERETNYIAPEIGLIFFSLDDKFSHYNYSLN